MIKPLNDYVLLKKTESSDRTKSGIIISSSLNNNMAKVIAVGKSCCEDIKVSQNVFYIEDNINRILHNGEEYIVVKYTDIISVIE